jgi:hypothetical protein
MITGKGHGVIFPWRNEQGGFAILGEDLPGWPHLDVTGKVFRLFPISF